MPEEKAGDDVVTMTPKGKANHEVVRALTWPCEGPDHTFTLNMVSRAGPRGLLFACPSAFHAQSSVPTRPNRAGSSASDLIS
jgi:hypothetical protein